MYVERNVVHRADLPFRSAAKRRLAQGENFCQIAYFDERHEKDGNKTKSVIPSEEDHSLVNDLRSRESALSDCPKEGVEQEPAFELPSALTLSQSSAPPPVPLPC